MPHVSTLFTYAYIYRSAPINLEDIGSSYFRLQLSESRTDIRLMRADVKLGGSTIFVVISQAEEGWPFIMENDSNQDFTFYQTVRPSCSTHPIWIYSDSHVAGYGSSRQLTEQDIWPQICLAEKTTRVLRVGYPLSQGETDNALH